MDLTKTIEEIGKYLNELLGFLIPGLIFNILFYLLIDEKYLPILESKFLFNPWAVILLSYTTGYFVYGLCIYRDNFIKKISARKILIEEIIEKIESSLEYVISKKKLVSLLPDAEKLRFNSIRSLCMSYVPEVDQKIYTFMFRADLSNNVGLVALFFGLWLLLSILTNCFFNNTLLIKSIITKMYYIPVIFFIISYIFHLTRKRFLEIAYKIIFSIFIAKVNPINK